MKIKNQFSSLCWNIQCLEHNINNSVRWTIFKQPSIVLFPVSTTTYFRPRSQTWIHMTQLWYLQDFPSVGICLSVIKFWYQSEQRNTQLTKDPPPISCQADVFTGGHWAMVGFNLPMVTRLHHLVLQHRPDAPAMHDLWYRIETSHWSRFVEILCSDWMRK